ncbi:MAG: hypothetical protein LBO74_02400 [Candidatus Symbiothrix sp.]|jgi:hypothetical protein|nr:hypothetical protein [Candidatus Symbiothrix sp.]
MKATFEDFITHNPVCGKFADDSDAKQVFEIMSYDRNIIAMVDASEAGKPALSVVVSEIEDYFNETACEIFTFYDVFVKNTVGRMINTILSPFGYQSNIQKNLPTNCQSLYFKSGTCYVYEGDATMRIVKIIEEIEPSIIRNSMPVINMIASPSSSQEDGRNYYEIDESKSSRKPFHREMVRDAVQNLNKSSFTHEEILDWIEDKYGAVNRESITTDIYSYTVNLSSRTNFPMNMKSRIADDERYDFLYCPDLENKSVVELYNPKNSVHGEWEIYELDNGKFNVRRLEK